ncbi:MAG: cellulase family glycosylhydrolase [Ruminococcus sp.]|nr:cellulase family glycosylhydrolase [Ruminococcus sp.]MDE6785345.1 cellulase family glycosylhydrolase [Ruminococcus sp.]
MNKLTRTFAAFVSAAAMAITGTAASVMQISEPVDTLAVDDNNDDWLHAEGSRLYDMNGNEVWLTGANWFGLNCIEYSPHYLYAGDIDDMLQEVADRGINVIRFPISTELILSWKNGTPYQISSGGMQAVYNPPVDQDDGNGGVVKAGTYGNLNKDFVESDGKTLITSDRGFDIILDKCKKYGIKAFIDIHSPHADNSGHNYNLWYGKETADGTMVTTKIWQDTLVWIADKYKNNDTLLGYDLKNEPHGKGQEGEKAAKWDGSTDENNWAYAATKCADAILEVNPNALIFIEGVEQSLSGAMPGDYWGIEDRMTNSPYIGAWWGGNFRGAREYPIKPEHGTSQIVYSPHDYGPSVYAQTWFDKDFTTQTLLDDYWYDTWAYINAEDIAPELIGEWGGHMDGAENQKWMELLRDYMIENHINHTFWCLNTNSGDTGGLWKNISCGQQAGSTQIQWEEEKYALMEKSLWQTQETGKYIGLDHQKALGNNGLSLNEFYTSYASTEGSNLDGGTIVKDGKPVVSNPSTPTEPAATTAAPSVTTTAPAVTTTSAQTSTGNGNTDSTMFGDANLDGEVSVADATLILQYLGNKDKYTLSEQGFKNADCCDNGDGISTLDALAVQLLDAGQIDKLPMTSNK